MTNETVLHVDSTVQPANAEQVLRDVQDALRRHGCAMVSDDGRVVLCRVMNDRSALALAIVQEIKPGRIAWKPIQVGAAYRVTEGV